METNGGIWNREFVFIIGSPRSGTTWLHTLLAEHPQVASIAPVELTHFSNYLPPLIDRWEAQKKNIAEKKTQGLPVIWTDEEFENFLRRFTAEVYGKVLEKRPAATHIVDKHPNYSNYLHVIDRFLPNAKFIHVLRDGRDVMISSKSAYERERFMHDDVTVMAKKWKLYIENARKFSAQKDRFHEVKYEDLLADGKEKLKRVFEFCNLPCTDAFIDEILDRNSFSKKPVSSANASINAIRSQKERLYKEHLTLEERYIFTVIAGNLMRELGYAPDDSWIFSGSADKLKLQLTKLRYKLKNMFRS